MKTCHFLVAAFAAIVAVSVHAATIMVEAEAFADKGGWSVDQQFMDQMGSPFLLAHGMGVPVKDATTTVKIAEKGEYRVLVRTRNWSAPWSGDRTPAGRFQLLVNGSAVGGELGVGKSEWNWAEAAKVALEPGEVKLALHDLTGFDGRVDAIILTSDKNFIAPEKKESIELLRRKLGTLVTSRETVDADLVVVGGGIAGTCAAISAARLGLKVALVHDRPMVGGCNSSEVRVHLGGRVGIGPYPQLGGVLAEIGPGPQHFGNAQPASFYEDERKMSAIAAEKNITLFANTHVTRVETFPSKKVANGRKIIAVYGQNIETGVETRFAAPLFADCTGDGTVGAFAGAEFRYGRESKAESGEPGAVDKADRQTMGASVQWYSVKENDAQPFKAIDWALPGFNAKTARKVYMGEWTWETGMRHDQVEEAEYVRDYGLMVVYSNWNYLKNLAADAVREDYSNRRLGWVAFVAGKRESRRLVGDLVLSENDIAGRVEYPDGTACSSWTIDLHYPEEQNEKDFPNDPFISQAKHQLVHYYPIPYRCLYSKNVTNLFMAGRNISVTHVALGTVRVMRTGGMLGEVVGMAASICSAKGCSPRDVYSNADSLEQLKGLMKKGAGTFEGQPHQFYNTGGTLSTSKACHIPAEAK